ncbi:MAG: DUF167 domain-containing protein [Myxococcota bacterium]
MTALELRRVDGGIEVPVLVQPRAARDQVGGTHGGALRVRVNAPAIEGRANDAVRKALARALGVRPAAVQVITGERERRKHLRVEGDPSGLEARLRELEQGEQPV